MKWLPYSLLIPVLLVGFLPGPALLGIWESLTYYHTFGAVSSPLCLLIAPRANVGGQGYALLEMARPIIHGLHLPLNLWTFRVPAVLFGTVSLLLFFTICRRYFKTWPALGATALLAGNQVFFQYEHMMTVVVVSGAALLFVIERLQALEFKYWDAKIWAGFALSVAVVSLNYGPARIFSVILIGLWFAKIYWQLKKVPGSNTLRHGIWVLGVYSAAAATFLLTLLDYRNLVSILRFSTFLFPKNAETMTFTAASEGGPGFAIMLGTNLRILSDSLLGNIGEFYSRFPSYILADFRFPLLNKFVVPFVFLGLVVTIISWRRRGMLLATPWGSLLAMLAVFSLPLLTSSVVLKSDGLLATLSSHRMYFCLFPMHLLIAAFFYWVATCGVGRTGKYGVALCATAIFCGMTVNLYEEQLRFKNQVFATNWQKHGQEIWKTWDDHAPNVDRRDYTFVSHLQQHAQYANVARQIADKLREQRIGTTSMARRIIFVDVNKFSEAPITPGGLDYIAHRNYHSIFLTLYAGQEGVPLNPVVMVDPKRRPIAPGLMSGLAYKGKPREYSALTELDKKGRLVYKGGQEIIPVVVELTGASSYDILVTTPEEEAGARQLLEKEHIPFEYVKI